MPDSTMYHRVFAWETTLDHYDGLGWIDEDYGKADEHFRYSKPYGALWRKRLLIRHKNPSTADRPISDSPPCNTALRILSRRALEALRDLIEPSCEILPLESALGDFYAINCLAQVDCVDLAKSDFRTYDSGRVAQMYTWVFEPDRLPNVHVFRTPESFQTFLVSPTFMARVREHRLLGFMFYTLWSETGGGVPQRRAIGQKHPQHVVPDWELKEIRRLKAELRRQRNETKSKSGAKNRDGEGGTDQIPWH